MTTDLERLQRIRDIDDKDVKQTKEGFEIRSATGNKEITYLVYYSTNQNKWICTCKDYMYRNNEDNPLYECKHIGKVQDMQLRRLKK